MDFLEEANRRIDALRQAMLEPVIPVNGMPVYIGADIGTANVVTVAVDAEGNPLAGEIQPARVVREGLIVDYLSAVTIITKQVESIRAKLNVDFTSAASAFPPNTENGNIKVTRNILETAGLCVGNMFDEPSAAAVALGVGEGAVVDIGGGTTGVSILKKGRVIFTTDEPTGGFQFDLVIAGGLGISLEEAERRKRNPAAQVQLFSVVRPVMEKIASITMRAIQGYGVKNIYLVGGTCGFPGFADLIRQETGISTYLPDTPLYVTPLGIAMSCANSNKNTTPGKSKTNRDRRPRPK